MCAFNETRHIGKDETPAVFEIADTEVWNQGGEWVICGWDVGFADYVKESRFANAWETDKTGIGKEFEFKDQTFLLTWMSVLGNSWDSVTGRFEASVASSSASAFGDKDLLALLFDIG